MDDRSCYADYSESTVYGDTWGVYNITENSNHWDAANTLQPRLERSLSRSGESGVGSYAKFTGTLRILEVGDTSGDINDGSYLMQAKGKHTGGGGAPDPAICLYLAKPVYGTDCDGNQSQVSFDIYREQINYRGGEGAGGRSIVFLRNVEKDEIVDIELEVGFREDPNYPASKVHYADAIIGGEAFNWNIPEPDRGLESGIRYGAYRVKGGRAQMRWSNTTYEKVEVVDDSDPTDAIVRLRNVATGEFLTAGGGGSQPVTMSTSGDAENTHWKIFTNANYKYNIDSETTSGGPGVLRGLNSGSDYLVVSTLKAPPTTDIDKSWTIEYDPNTETYRFLSRFMNRYLYQNEDGTVTQTVADATDNRSVWEAIPLSSILPLDFFSFTAQSVKLGTQLNWEIGNVVNNSYFEVLKANDFNEFKSIGRIENDNRKKYYQFIDPEISRQTSYYKIKQVDIDGEFSFSKLVSVKPNVESAALDLYPNPVQRNDYLTINSGSPHGYQIFNSQGVLIRKVSDNTFRVDLEKGIYFLKPNHSSEVERFIVY